MTLRHSLIISSIFMASFAYACGGSVSDPPSEGSAQGALTPADDSAASAETKEECDRGDGKTGDHPGDGTAEKGPKESHRSKANDANKPLPPNAPGVPNGPPKACDRPKD